MNCIALHFLLFLFVKKCACVYESIYVFLVKMKTCEVVDNFTKIIKRIVFEVNGN